MNYYVILPTGQLLFRGSEQQCVDYCKNRIKTWRNVGMELPYTLRVFYDAATEASHTFKGVNPRCL